jgi:hypothetical protein
MPPPEGKLAETALYRPVKAFLERQGFVVKGEVGPCDLVAVREAEPPVLVVAELKLGFSLELLLQATDRMRMADRVYLAVRASRRGRDRDTRTHRLCRLLGLGLLAVDPGRGLVEVLTEPGPYRPSPDRKRRLRLLREHAGRVGDPTPGGGNRAPVMTAYRQRALRCAAALRDGSRPVAGLRAVEPEAGPILLRNVYGWFTRESRGVYALTEAGRHALLRWDVAAPALPG